MQQATLQRSTFGAKPRFSGMQSLSARSGLACPAMIGRARKPLSCVASAKRDVSARVAEAAAAECVEATEATPSKVDWASMSYSQQYDLLFKEPLNTKRAIPKPSKEAQLKEIGHGGVFLSDFGTIPKRPFFLTREWNDTDKRLLAFVGGMHILALAAPFTFSWENFYLFMTMYFVTGCLGITLSYHRMLSHRSFTAPKWLEYIMAYCGVMAVEGDPIEWSSSHRYHHLHTDTPLDPHSPYEGFWWCHMGWLLDNEATLQRVSDRRNAEDLSNQPYYRWLKDTYVWHVAAQFVALYLLGGFPAIVWGGALRMCWVWHITWFVNSASHCWGYQDYNTGDLSRNNWWVGILAFGEGWHNNHHAFEYSARHGLEWWQFDMTWIIISTMEKLGVFTNVKLPTEKAKAKLAFKPKALSS